MCAKFIKIGFLWGREGGFSDFEIRLESASLTPARTRQNHSTRVFKFASKFCKTLVIK